MLFALAWACGGGGGATDEICDNYVDDDGDQRADCDDSDCAAHIACQPDGDGDADGDSDGDADGDSDGDADGDGDADECERDCSGSQLFDHCEIGVCNDFSDNNADCCVSTETTCSTTVTVGDLLSDFSIDYRGFYVDDYRCIVERYESAGHEEFQFQLQKQGLACENGFVHVRVRGRVEEIEVGTTYELCSDNTPPNLRVTVNVGYGGTDQTAFTNYACDSPGEFTITEMGTETGEPYAFNLRGRLMELDDGGQPTGTTIDVDIDSTGLVEFDLTE